VVLFGFNKVGSDAGGPEGVHDPGKHGRICRCSLNSCHVGAGLRPVSRQGIMVEVRQFSRSSLASSHTEQRGIAIDVGLE
jgi:hypothetical protein